MQPLQDVLRTNISRAFDMVEQESCISSPRKSALLHMPIYKSFAVSLSRDLHSLLHLPWMGVRSRAQFLQAPELTPLERRKAAVAVLRSSKAQSNAV